MDTVSAAAAVWDWEQTSQLASEALWNIIRVATVILVCTLVAWILRVIIRRIVDRIVHGAKTRARVADTQALERSPVAQVRLVQRTRTLGSILQNVVNIIVVIVALVLTIAILAPNVLGSLTLLTAAIGAGLGFGAQNIVKDVLNGMFLVAEDQIGIGDVVDLGLASGVVEYVSVRITHVRDANGTLWYVRNGEITRIGNMSMGWSRVIIDLSVPFEADLDAVEKVLLETAAELSQEPKWQSRVIEQPEVWGLESITGDTLVIRVVMKTRANAREDVGRELRVRIARRMRDMGIDAPLVASVTLTGQEAARRVRGANPPKTRPNPVPPTTPERPVWRAKRQPDPGEETPS